MYKMTKGFKLGLIFLLIFTLIFPTTVNANQFKTLTKSIETETTSFTNKISDDVLDSFETDEKVTFLVKFREKADVEKVAKEAKQRATRFGLSINDTELVQRSAVISELKVTSLESQGNVKKYLEEEQQKGNVDNIISFYIVNGMAVTATKDVAEKLSTFSEVEKILPNEKRELVTSSVADFKEAIEKASSNVEWHIDRVNAPDVWEMGIDGSGIVVASIDTGVQWDHPALKNKYRGYNPITGEVDHTYSFYDPVYGNKVPYDDDGHGTHVTGIMVGSEPNDSYQIGVAPGAKWIAVQAFRGDSAYDSDLLAAAEWIMAPGGDYTKAPDVVNNSWGGGKGLNEWYRDAVIAWREAGIFPVFAAGNTTPSNEGGPGSVAIPANYPESFAVGATDSSNNLAEFSLRGPSPYDEIKPDVSAPGVGILSSIPDDHYAYANGTSMAAPVVAGVVALLKQANYDLKVQDIENILKSTAVKRTDSEYPDSPNNGYGYGIVDAEKAIQYVLGDSFGKIVGSVMSEELQPLEANIKIVETGFTTKTNPVDGRYTLSHKSGNYTIIAEANGYLPQQHNVTVRESETIEIDFKLQKKPVSTISGTVKNAKTKTPISEATILLVEDANVNPVMTDTNGNYQITAPYGKYTVKIVANSYFSKEIEIDLNSNKTLNIELEPKNLTPGQVIAYDNGYVQGATVLGSAGNGIAVKMSLPSGMESAILSEVSLQFYHKYWPDPGGEDFAIEIWSSDNNGYPEKRISERIYGKAIRDITQWTILDLSEYLIKVEKDFFVVYIQVNDNPNVPGLSFDNSINSGRNYLHYDGVFFNTRDRDETGNYMIRSTVSQLSLDVERIRGTNRYETSIEVSRQGWESADTVIIARGDDYADALAGVPLAYHMDAPILLTPKNRLLGSTLDEIKRLGAKKVYILGGTGAVSDQILTDLGKAGLSAERISGKNRFETAVAIAKKMAPNGVDQVIIANGLNFPDTLSIASYAAKSGIPILLTTTNSLSKATKDAIDQLGIKSTIVVGGKSAVSDNVKNSLPNATRISGANRFETNIEIAKVFGGNQKFIYLATGMDFADALTGAVLAAKDDTGVLLVSRNLPNIVKDYILEEKIVRINVFGGTVAVSDHIIHTLINLYH